MALVLTRPLDGRPAGAIVPAGTYPKEQLIRLMAEGRIIDDKVEVKDDGVHDSGAGKSVPRNKRNRR